MIFTADKARHIARQCRQDDPDWNYRAEIAGEYGRVKVYDEERTFIGYLGDYSVEKHYGL